MCKKLIYLISFVLVLALAGNALAVWDDGGADNLWSTPENWSGDTVPTSTDRADIPSDTPGATVANPGAVCAGSLVGWVGKGNGALTIDGGDLHVYRTTGTQFGWLALGHAPSVTGQLYMKSGSLICDNKLQIGAAGADTPRSALYMTGGTITIDSASSGQGLRTGVSGHIQLDGGTITTLKLDMFGPGSMDIGGGTLIIDGDVTVNVQTFIDFGWITAYGGSGTVLLDYDVTNPGKTTLKAFGFNLNPNPADGSTVPITTNQLQWTLPEPNEPGGVVDCVVYFGTIPSPIEDNPKVVDRQAVESVSVTLAANTTYYWALDLYDSSISTTDPFYLAPIFTFDTMNTAPDVNAGDDVATWLDNGERVVQLDGVVSDEDGGPGPATLSWTVIAEPNELNPAQISDPLAANTTVTIKEPGSYTLQLEASDGEYTTTDTMQIVLYADSCEHAKNEPGFVRLVGDLYYDCKVDFLDLANFAASWLDENYSTE